MTRANLFFLLLISTFAGSVMLTGTLWAGEGANSTFLPTFEGGSLAPADTPERVATVLKTVALLTVLTLAPSILLMMTGFTRIVIVLGFVRRALGTNTLPPDQALVGLALFLTMFIMAPTFTASWNNGLGPFLNGELDPATGKEFTQEAAITRTMQPYRLFMWNCLKANEGGRELAFFAGISGKPIDEQEATLLKEVSTIALIPAFVTAEFKKAFWMGFLLYLPFLILDVVIASVLMSMGMMMLPPVMISLPFKLILFVMVDGWILIVEGLTASFPANVLPNFAFG